MRSGNYRFAPEILDFLKEGEFEYIEKYTLFDSARGAEILPAQRPGHPIEFYPERRERNLTRHLFS
jgi:hypothetical protein